MGECSVPTGVGAVVEEALTEGFNVDEVGDRDLLVGTNETGACVPSTSDGDSVVFVALGVGDRDGAIVSFLIDDGDCVFAVGG